MDPLQFRLHVIRPVLHHTELWSESAENLVLGTALVESGLRHLDQVTGKGDVTLGPALGLYQIEPATHRDLWLNFLPARRQLRDRIAALTAPWPERETQLVTNLAYATAICRALYFRRREPLPAADDVAALGRYWKRWYNTPLGKGDPAEFVTRFRAAHRG